jgi:hypothetical protein
MTAARLQQQFRWLRSARHALTYSLRVRLVALFVLLALAMAATFVILACKPRCRLDGVMRPVRWSWTM